MFELSLLGLLWYHHALFNSREKSPLLRSDYCIAHALRTSQLFFFCIVTPRYTVDDVTAVQTSF